MQLFAAADFAPAHAPPELADTEIHLWFFPHWEKTSDAAGSPALRALLAAYLGATPDQVRIERGEHGKPRLAGLEFNLAHAGSVLLAGVSRDIELGVDVEPLARRTHDVLALARRWFAAHEAETLAALPAALRAQAFLRLWTCKEAVLKCSGLGLGAGLHRTEFELSAAAEVRAVRMAPGAGAAWRLATLTPDAAHVGALAYRGRPAAVRTFVMQTIAGATQSG